MAIPQVLQSRLFSLTPSTTPPFRQAFLRSAKRPQTRLQSTKPHTSSPRPTTIAASPQPTTKQTTRLDRVIARTQRWLPRRFHQPLQNFRSAPGSHIVAFLMVHEITAILPIFGLVAFFQYYDVVPAAYVFGPWAPYVQEGAFKLLGWFRKKGWFGLGAEDVREGEERFESELGWEAAEQERGHGKGKSVWALWGRLRSGQEGKEADGAEEVVEQAKSKTKRAVELAKEKATLKNTEAGYKIGVQLVAAYAIVKVLLIPRIAFSLWVTPPVARGMIWTRQSLSRLFKR